MSQSESIALYQPLLQSIAYKILRCKADAEDAVQDTFLKWLSAEREKINNTKAYLIKAVTNTCINKLNSIKQKKEEWLDSIHLPEFIEKIETSFSNLDIEAELSRAFKVLQNKLEPLERAVFLLKEVFDFDYETVQDILNKKKEHCRQLLSRAKKKLDQETRKFTFEFPNKVQLMDSFRKACDIGHVSEFISDLKKDITTAIEKKF